MTHPPLQGLLVPLITPFDPATGDPAAEPLKQHALACLAAGVDGIVAAGSTGEAAMLTEREFAQVVEWLRDVTPAGRTLIVGTGRESTRATIAACRTAGDLGADAALVRAPSYYGSSLNPAALARHFRDVADGSPVPVLVYNIPKYVHLALPDTLLAALATHPNVVGAKDSSGDLKTFTAYRAAAPQWAHFMGSGSHFGAALELGAVGGILAIANVAMELALEVMRQWRAGDPHGAAAAQERLTSLNTLIVGELGVPGVKAAMDVLGRPGGRVRPPLADLGQDGRERISAALRAAGVLVGTSSG
jgi:dihydrodipicolinate synthase/N-acetylneuraminate lyase